MKTNIFKAISISTVFLMVITLIPVPNLFAANDLQQVQGAQNASYSTPNVQPGTSNLVPVGYGTSYAGQYPSYASFMQSPYNGNAANGAGMPPTQPFIATSFAPQVPGSPGTMNPGMNPVMRNNMDPYAASEVSPYSRYSPYLEVIGEGSDYTLGIDDVVTVIVRNQPDFSGRFVVDPEGNIQYNFVGDIPALGKTKEELKQDIMNRLRRFVRYPEVAVMISEYRSKAVYVFGFVNNPGKYAMKGNKITVKEAIVAAGLPRADGSLKRVYVIRPSQYTDSGEAEQKKVDLKKLLQKGDSAEDFLLEPGDTIVVHQRYFDRFVNGFSRLVGPLFQASAVYELAYGDHKGGWLN